MSMMSPAKMIEVAPQECPKCGRDAMETTRLGKFCDAPLSDIGECKVPHSILDRKDWHNEHLHVTCDVCGFQWLRRPKDFSKRRMEEARAERALASITTQPKFTLSGSESGRMFPAPQPLHDYVPPVLKINGVPMTSLVFDGATFTVGRTPDEYRFVGQLPTREPEGELVARCNKCKTFAVGARVPIREGQHHCGSFENRGVFEVFKLVRNLPKVKTLKCDRCGREPQYPPLRDSELIGTARPSFQLPKGTQKGDRCRRRVFMCYDYEDCGGTIVEVTE